MTILICPCPDLNIDPQALADLLALGGVEARLTPPLCTPEGLTYLRRLLAAGPPPRLLAACGPEVNAGIFRRLTGESGWPVIELLSLNDLETAAGVLTLALAAPPRPEAKPARIFQDVLVVGGGIGGCQAALDLARAGLKVILRAARSRTRRSPR